MIERLTKIHLYMADEKTKVLLITMFSLIVVSIAVTYYQTVISRDFEVIDDLDEDVIDM